MVHSFGQLVIGPPGSGKTTYCHGMQQFCKLMERETLLVNLDPGNDGVPYEADIDIRDLISLENVMAEQGLGPNGGLVFAMDYIVANFDWLQDRLSPFVGTHYFVFDFPGQVELFTHQAVVRKLVEKLTNDVHLRLAAVHLVDAHYCSDPAKYVSVLLVSLSTMLHLELPHVNILSKADLLPTLGKLDLPLDFYTDVMDLSYLLDLLDSKRATARYSQLNKAICEIVEDFSLVSFKLLEVQSRKRVYDVLKMVDRANGHAFGFSDSANERALFETAMGDTDYESEVMERRDRYQPQRIDDSTPMNPLANPSSLSVTEKGWDPSKP